MSARLVNELLRRRVPQVIGVYLAAGWGLLEFTDWATGRFALSAGVEDFVVVSWALLLPIIAGAAWRFGAPERRRRALDRVAPAAAEASRPTDILVLPFANLSANAGDEYLSDGICEEIINQLAHMEGLQVVARTSAYAYKEKAGDVRTIGRELGAGAVLEGSVQRSGDRLRVTTQLVEVASGYHLWSERYDREMKDVFDIEDDIAASVVEALRGILKPEEREALARNPTDDVEAYEFYLRGKQFFRQSRRKSLEYARQMFERAVEVDPHFALAWCGVADSILLTHMYYPGSGADLEKADEASLRALELSPGLSEAHGSRGFALLQADRFEEAEAEFQAAIRLDPNQFDARYFYARGCFAHGRLEDAARLFQEASEVREDYQAAFFAAQALEALGREDEATVGYRKALAVAEKHMELNPDDPRAATMRAVSLCRCGERDAGLRWAERALEIDPTDAGVRYNVACLYSLEDSPDQAIECLEKAVEAGFGNRDWIAQDPDLDRLRDHPRFQQLLRQFPSG
ncbi:MAG: tetratricopeptide repeat protein [Candidatus Palauibacterales bacterium]|nr:tetratricopeptide repeat protein [Candidatus Palauibacterales bacterium]MDP2483907.1 tetratricopeptide repeat protein [Candidatus Palauibacterales bacterium]